MSKGRIELVVSEDDEDVAYLSLPQHPGSVASVVKKSIRLRDILGSYEGPDLVMDFDEHNALIGLEILC